MKKFLPVLSIIFLLFIIYFSWCRYDRINSTEGFYPRYVLENVKAYGQNKGKGNIIALSPYFHTYDFSSQQAFYNMLYYYFSFAKRKNMFNDSTIIILPEYTGTWLVAANEKREVFKDTSLEKSMQTMIISNPFKFLSSYLYAKSKNKNAEAIFKMKSDNMLEIYQQTFSSLAKEFKVVIVAGSIVLPDPKVIDGKIKIDQKEKLYNVSAVFDVNGNVFPSLTKKIFPIEEEKEFTSSGNSNDLAIYKTAAGNLAVLICADAWYPRNYEKLKSLHADILAVPALVNGSDVWNNKWKGYNGAATPADIDKSDIAKITEHDAWLKYGMTGRLNNTGIKTGVNSFLQGDLWRIHFNGNTLIYKDSVIETKNVTDSTGSLINVWLE